MSQTQALVNRIYALAAKLNKEPSTVSRTILGSGARLAELENGSSMSFKTFEKVQERLSEEERKAA